jgi:Leucine-rich repeat (LRR) protein
MRTITEATAALRAAATDPHRLLHALAEAGDPALFDALLSSTTLRPLGGDDLQEPVSSRFRGAESALLLRGLIALAPPDSAVAARLRASWTGILLSADPDRPDTVSARYLDRLPALEKVQVESAIGVTHLSDLAAHPGLSELRFESCSLLGADLSGLSGARIETLRWSGHHPLVLEDFALSGLSGASISRLEIIVTWKITAIPDWPADLRDLTLHSAVIPDRPPLPDTLTHLHLIAVPPPDPGELPASLESLRLMGVMMSDLSGFPPLPRLRELLLTQGSAPDLRWLPPSLTTLTLSGDVQLGSLAGIEAVTGLTVVDLSGCPELDRSPLSALPLLRRVLPEVPATAPPPPRRRAVRTAVPPQCARAWQTIRELLRSNSPEATEQAIELVRALCSPELVEVLLSGVTLREDGGWQELSVGRRFSGHRQPAALAFLAAAGVGESAALKASVTALRVACPVLDAADLAALPELRRLSLVGVKELRSPERLSGLERLSALHLSRCALPAGMRIPPGVRRLEADRLPRWSDLSALSDCGRMESLSIGDAPSLSSLRGLSGPVLSEVDLERAEALEGVGGLSDAPALERLRITGALRLTDLSALTDHPALTQLCIQQAARLAAVPPLPALTSLTLELAPLTDLPDLPALTSLSLSRCESLVSIGQPGPALASVQLLQCERLTSIAPLAGCRGLRGVHLVGCPLLGDLSPLSGLSGLTRLTVRDSPAPLDLSPLSDCPGITELDLRGCTGLTGLSALADLPALAILRLGRTGLTRIDLPPGLRRLARWGG